MSPKKVKVRKVKINRKNQMTPEKRRRQKEARSRLASMAGVLAAVALTIVCIWTGITADVELTVLSDEYECFATEAPVTEVSEAMPDVPAVGDPDAPAAAVDPAIRAAASVNPKLHEPYAVEMIIQSPYAIVYDVESDEVLYAKNAEEKCFPASTTKILTAATILSNAPEDFVFTAGDELDFVNAGSSLAMITKGCQLDVPTMIDALMLPSGNDASYTAAANIGRLLADDENLPADKAVEEFMEEMNRTARRIGCENTHFTVPDGFHDDEHYTTVKDMLKITLYAENFDYLMESAKKSYSNATFITGEQISWTNSNQLIHEYSDNYYMYATGLKTGMTDQSGHCVVATAERFGHQLICIVFGSESAALRWNDTIALLDASFVKVREKTRAE